MTRRLLTRHGTVANYQRGCHCPDCRQAEAARRRRATARYRAPFANQMCPLCDTWFVSVAGHEAKFHTRPTNKETT